MRHLFMTHLMPIGHNRFGTRNKRKDKYFRMTTAARISTELDTDANLDVKKIVICQKYYWFSYTQDSEYSNALKGLLFQM